MRLRFAADLPPRATVLCLGAHCDDIEIGCGGTLVELRAARPDLRFAWTVFSGDERREAETRAAAVALLGEGPHLSVEVRRFRTSYFPAAWAEIKDAFEELRARHPADLVLTHCLADRHQDHRLVAELTWNTFRTHALLEYEIPKYEGDLAHPGVFVPLAPATVDRKVEALMRSFASQRHREWFDEAVFRGHLRLRGMECASPTRYAEAFHGRKIVLK